ncbi:hypothetical protein ACSMDK_23865 [Yersinia enterocolitica]|uniref:hypothetical protein n=1 Tax=Yersinia TaxID=629 RepID=UPI0032F4C8ED|nr:hypothetical protein [Yersinia enterocolitica]HDL6983588.1 hypothetical protein [Yersinia enterocolitica]HDL7066705.1 hypothetical protein [Yersinia enterocolitica]HDL7071091.1 hypothetical protein [Yersinia enterocolitica]HDL7467085.1 hypothetical protein [Yersinia enterocolitica]
MSVNIQAAVLTNLVKWKSDVQSMKKVRDDMKRLKKEAAGILDNSITPKSAAHGVKMAKQAAQSQVSAMKKVYGSAGVKGGLGTGMLGKPSKDWLQTSLAQTKAMEQTGKAQQAQTQATKEAALAEKRKVQLKKQSELALKREINGTMKLRDATFTISRMENLGVGQRYKAIQQAKLLSNEYKKGNLDLAEMNQQMKFLTANTRRLKAQQAKTKAQQGRKGGGALLGVGLGGYAAAAAVGGAYAAYSSASSSVERAKGVNKLTKAGADSSYEAQALQRLVQTKGIDANLENVFQDLQEKLGELVSQSTFDRRSGKLKGGGELTDTFNDLFAPLKYTLADVAKMSSSEFIVQMQLNGKQLKKSAQEMRYYEETVNDLSRVSGLFANNGKEVIDTIQDMKKKGQMLSDEQLTSLTKLREWSIAVSSASQTLGDKFTLALESSIGGSEGVAKAFRDVEPLIQGFGTALGKLTLLISWIVSKIPFLRSQEEIRADSLKTHQENLTKGGIRQWIAEVGRDGMKAYNGSSSSLTPQAMIPTASSLQPQPYQPSAAYTAPVNHITVKPADVHISTDVGRLEGIFSVISENSINDYNNNILNDINSSYLNR